MLVFLFSADVMLFKRQDARFGERLHDRKVVLHSGSFSSGIPRSPSPCITTIHLAAIFICWPVVALHADDCGDDRSKQLPGPSNAHQCFQSSKWTWLFLQKYLNERSVPLLVTVVHDESLSELSIYMHWRYRSPLSNMKAYQMPIVETGQMKLTWKISDLTSLKPLSILFYTQPNIVRAY